MGTIFWTLFGLIDQSSFQIDAHGYGAIWKTGMVLFGTFNIVAVLVALNMLIAILNESYTRITVRASNTHTHEQNKEMAGAFVEPPEFFCRCSQVNSKDTNFFSHV